MQHFDRQFVALNCPKCGYAIDVQLLSLQLEETVFCPACKTRIQLVDVDASAHRAKVDIDSSMTEIQRRLKELGKSLKFKI